MKPILWPPPLQNGSCLAIVAPASNLASDKAVQAAIESVRAMGYRVWVGDSLRLRRGYLAGSEPIRAKDLHDAFADPQVDGILCLRGGYGCLRLLPYLEMDRIANHPKPLIGFSDITAMLNAISQATGLVTFHGPNANQVWTPYTRTQFHKLLHDPRPDMPLATPLGHTEEGWHMLLATDPRTGLDLPVPTTDKHTVAGRLIGGNLSILTRLLGTAFAPEFKDAILLMEDVDEEPRRVDGMLAQLALAGHLKQLRGYALGQFTQAEPRMKPSLTLDQVLQDYLCLPTTVPLAVGHGDQNATVPIGVPKFVYNAARAAAYEDFNAASTDWINCSKNSS